MRSSIPPSNSADSLPQESSAASLPPTGKAPIESPARSTFTLGVGPYADLTEAEFVRRFTGAPDAPAKLDGPRYLGAHDSSMAAAPEAVDWTTTGVVTPVKNQASCGSCWSFSTTGVIESAYAIKTGTLVSLAEQELVDCMVVNKTIGNGTGCGGGWPYKALEFAADNDMCTEASYPYTAKDGKCAKSGCTAGIKQGAVLGYKDVPKTEKALLSATAAMPISITVKAESNMQHYASGVLSVPCNGSSINHAVLTVGYGTDPEYGDYYKVKNSWGTSYGDEGYFKMARSDSVNPSCLYNDSPVYPSLA